MSVNYIKFFKFIVSTQYGYTAEKTFLENGDAKYLRITDIVPYFVDKDSVPYCEIEQKRKEQYLVKAGDLLIARTGATTGYNLLVDESFVNYVFASYLIRFNYDKDKLAPLYVKYVLKSQQWYGFVNNYIGGSAQPGMNAKTFGRFDFPYFEKNYQQKIAGILSKYDEAIENNNKRIKLLEQMAQNLYKEWFVRFRFPGWQRAEFENGIPKGWKVEKLGNLFERLPFGRTYKKEDLEKEGSVIVIDQSTDDYLGFHNDEPAYKANFESPMILFGDHTCKFVLMTRDFSLGENIIPIKPRNCNPYYLFRSIDGIIKTTEYKRHWSILITQKIFIPSENLQNKFGEVYRSFIKQIENLTQQTQNLSRQRDLLLPRLMSGKLQVFRK